MTFIWNHPITGWDVLGMFGDGNASGYKGHDNYTTPNGLSSFGDMDFDYASEDHGKNRPIPEKISQLIKGEFNPEGHFQDIETSVKQVNFAINNCNNKAYAAAMHRYQDYFTHYAKGTRWAPLEIWNNLGFGHVGDGTTPDEDNSAWKRANDLTNEFNQKWNENCCKCGDKYNLKSIGPCNK